MNWNKKDVIQAITTLTDPFEEEQENPLDIFRKKINSPVPQLPFSAPGNNGQ